MRIQIGPFKMKLVIVAFVMAVVNVESKAICYSPRNINWCDTSYEELPMQPPISQQQRAFSDIFTMFKVTKRPKHRVTIAPYWLNM
ncbi:unnamed protein product, partial [Tenebrio molitor]